MDIEIHIYHWRGYLLGKKMFQAGVDMGGLTGYNKVSINEILNYEKLPAGIYMFLIIYKDEVLAKEKIAVLP
jgi:hypothetical protein